MFLLCSCYVLVHVLVHVLVLVLVLVLGLVLVLVLNLRLNSLLDVTPRCFLFSGQNGHPGKVLFHPTVDVYATRL